VTWGCSLGRSPTTGQWVNPPLVDPPALDYELSSTGVLVFSAKEETRIDDVAVVFTQKAWDLFSAWVSKTYEDGKVRWAVLEEANRP